MGGKRRVATVLVAIATTACASAGAAEPKTHGYPVAHLRRIGRQIAVGQVRFKNDRYTIRVARSTWGRAARISFPEGVTEGPANNAPVWVFQLKGKLAPCRRNEPCVARQERSAGAVMTITAIIEVHARRKGRTTRSVMDDTLPPLRLYGHVVDINKPIERST